MPPTKTRTERAFLTSISHLLNMGTSLIVSLLVTPVVVNWLGMEQYGAWVMAAQLIGYIALADLNPMNSLKLKLGVQQHLENYPEKRRLIGAAVVIALGLLPLFVFFSFIAAYLAPMAVKSNSFNAWDFQKAVFVLGINLSITALANLPPIVLRAANLEFKGMGVRAGGSVLLGIADISVVLLNGGLTGLAVNRLVYTGLLGVWHLRIAREAIPWIGASFPSVTDMRSIFSISVWGTLGALANVVGRNSDLLFIGMLFGPVLSAMVSLTQTPARIFCSYFYTLQGSMAGGAQDLIGRKEYARLTDIRYAVHGLFLTLFSMAAVIMVWCNEQLLNLWVGAGKYAGHALNIVLIFVSLAVLMSNLEGGTLAGFLKIKLWARVNIYLSIAGTAVALALGYRFGVSVFLTTILFFRAAQAILYNRLVNKEMHSATYWRDWWPAWGILSLGVGLSFYTRTAFFGQIRLYESAYGVLAGAFFAYLMFTRIIPGRAKEQLTLFKGKLSAQRLFLR